MAPMRRICTRLDLIFWLGVYGYSLWNRRPDWQYIIGMVIAGMGFALWCTARAQLGDSFSARPRARKLVTTGLYSKIRHPIYLFGTLAILSVCFGMHWYGVGAVLLAVSVIVQSYRARAEAKVLETAFGEEYRQYRARTWF